MTKYIDAEKLTKAIEDKGLDCSFALKMERLDTLALIDSLQQEQPEVDLEIERIVKDEEKFMNFQARHQLIGYVARHFYNMGLNARNED